MKKLIFGIIIGASFTALIGAGVAEYLVSKKTAEVNYINGLYVFTDSKPVMEFVTMGKVKATMTWQGQYQEVIPVLIKKARKEYPSAEGIIYVAPESAEVIMFK